MNSRTEQLIALLVSEANLTATEISDVLWLAQRIQPEVTFEFQEPEQTESEQQQAILVDGGTKIDSSFGSETVTEKPMDVAVPTSQTTGVR